MNTPHDPYISDDLHQLADAFRSCGWEAIFDSGPQEDYATKSQMLSVAAAEAESNGDQLCGGALRLLSRACFIMLSPEKPNEPFQPIMVLNGKRSVIPDDFTEFEIEFFAKILEFIDNPFLKGRLADLVWYRKYPRDVQFALTAIDSYRELPLDADTWFNDVGRCWQRAISLSLMIGNAARDRLVGMEATICAALESATTEQGFFGCWLADTLLSNKLGKNHATTVVTRLESLAYEFNVLSDYHSSERFYSASSTWAKYAGDEEKSADMTAAQAEAFINEAKARLVSEDPSYLAAASFLEDAVQLYRSIPRVHRERLNADARIAELKLLLSEYGRQSVDEMKTFQLPAIDISADIDKAREVMSGKPLFEALRAFASLHSTDATTLRASAIESLSNSSLRGLLPKVITSEDGRVIARTPGIIGIEPTEANEMEILAEMTRLHYLPLIAVVVHALILPALDVLVLEHRIGEPELIELSRRSPIVPPHRELLFGKALAHGFNRDFASSLHLLSPQIEHMVRFHLRGVGVNTTHLNQDGIEMEIGLSALMEIPETKRIFHENLCYEMKALFCEQTGPNLRNDIAHGLRDDDRVFSFEAVYAWWLALKMVLSPFWNAVEQTTAEND